MPARSPSDAPPPPVLTPVTGVARGSLGTATNLDDTQVYRLEELREPVFEPLAERAERTELADGPARGSAAPSLTLPPSVAPPSVVPPTPGRTRSRSRRSGVLAVAALAIVGLAAILAPRDGSPAGSGGFAGGAVNQGAGTFAPPATTEPAATPPPEAAGGGGGRGNANGHGNGNGRGNR